MARQAQPHRADGVAAHVEKELWLLRPGPRAALDESARAFADAALDVVLAGPGDASRAWADALAGDAARVRIDAALDVAPDDAATATWPALDAVLAAHARCLAVLERELLVAVVACALDVGALDPRRLRVDPGRAVLLRGGPRGLELRRANVLGPERDPGMPLPGGTR